MTASEMSLPVLRPDLQFFPGPRDENGAPTYTVFDPLTGRYHKLGWAEALILRHLEAGQTLSKLLATITTSSTLRPREEEVVALCRQAQRLGLTRDQSVRPPAELLRRWNEHHPGMWVWAISHYLFFRVPLLHPETFLAQTLPWVRPFASRIAILIYFFAGMLGLCLTIPRISEYLHTFLHFFTLQGAIAYALTLAALKIIHEFSHAYTATALGVRVRTMGIAFIFFGPVPFCDVTDAWRLPRRVDRFWIGFAGVAAEMAVAALALLGWNLLPDGTAKSLCFLLSSVTLASTLLVNLNPAMRFDGYYLLTDLWGIDNLQLRAFAVAKWHLRSLLLGIHLSPPEDGLSSRRIMGMLVYAIYTWCYRFSLYLGIAIMVYYFFHKALGIPLFLLEIWIFLVVPVVKEGRELWTMRTQFGWTRRAIGFIALLIGIALWGILPLPRRERFPAVALPVESQTLYAPFGGIVEDVSVRRGDRIKKGTHLLWIREPARETEINILRVERDLLARQLALVALEEGEGTPLQERKEELLRLEARLASLQNEVDRGRIQARIEGTLYEWDESIVPRRIVAENTPLGKIADPTRLKIQAFVKEDRLADLEIGKETVFLPRGSTQRIPGRIVSIAPARVEKIDHLALTSLRKGELPVFHDERGRWILAETFYAVEVALEGDLKGIGMGRSGSIEIRGKARSLVMDLLRHLWSVLLRESGF